MTGKISCLKHLMHEGAHLLGESEWVCSWWQGHSHLSANWEPPAPVVSSRRKRDGCTIGCWRDSLRRKLHTRWEFRHIPCMCTSSSFTESLNVAHGENFFPRCSESSPTPGIDPWRENQRIKVAPASDNALPPPPVVPPPPPPPPPPPSGPWTAAEHLVMAIKLLRKTWTLRNCLLPLTS